MEERLTKRDKEGNAVALNYIKTAGEFKEVVDRLAEYEDLEEQGLIVRLPCKVGTPIFLISNRSLISGKRCLYEGVVRGFVTDEYSTYYNLGLFTENINSGNIFFNRPEAEKKLEELNK